MTAVVSRQFLPVFDKPMIYYPLSTLMFTGIRDILIITTPQDQPLFQRLPGDGSEIGLHFSYAHQDSPRGLADAFIVGRDFVGNDPVALVLGDNIFYGNRLPEMLNQAAAQGHGATIFGLPRQHAGAIWRSRPRRRRTGTVDRGEASPAALQHRGDRALFLRQ